MASLLILPDEFLTGVREASDDLIHNNARPCRLVYPSVMEQCPNCLDWPGFSTNRYRAGGPIPFDVGACPLCNGTNQRLSEASEVVNFVLSWNPKDWTALPGNIRGLETDLQTKGFIGDLPKVLRCVEMVADLTLEAAIRQKVTLVGQPYDDRNIVKGRYFVANWKKVG